MTKKEKLTQIILNTDDLRRMYEEKIESYNNKLAAVNKTLINLRGELAACENE